MARAFNFSAGPATLPTTVLEQVQKDLVDYKGIGMSIMECSHRGKDYDAVHAEAIANVSKLLGLNDDYSVLFLQGGASSQFAMIPLNLLGEGETADYTNSGAWAGKAIKEAKLLGNVNVAADCGKEIPTRVPSIDELQLTDGAAYVHITSNETISGAQWKEFPKTDAPLIADMSSDILSRPFDATQFGLIYAGAQKNLGPSGLALVVIRKDLAEKAPEGLSTILKYSTHIDGDSRFNTPPTFGIYILSLVTRWILEQGQDELYAQNVAKAGKLYDALDTSDFYSATAVKECRSDMNVTFRLPTEELEKQFIAESTEHAMVGLKGHRSVGGVRASIYNAFPVEGIDALVSFMNEFEKTNG